MSRHIWPAVTGPGIPSSDRVREWNTGTGLGGRLDMQRLWVRIPLEANIYLALLALPGALPAPNLVNIPNQMGDP